MTAPPFVGAGSPLQVGTRQRTVHAFLSHTEHVLVVLALVFFSGAIVSLLWEGPDAGLRQGSTGSSTLLFLIQNGFYLAMLAPLLLVWRHAVAVLRADPFLWLLVGMTMLSTLWSADPSFTRRRSLIFLLTSLYGVYLAVRFPVRTQLRLIACSFLIVVAASVVFAVAVPSYGVMSAVHVGAWRGAFVHKNSLGRFCSLALPVFLLMWRSEQRHRWIYLWGMGLALLLMAMSTSKTAVLLTALTAALYLVARGLRARPALALPITLSLVTIGFGGLAVIMSFRSEFLTLLGRDATLTGRTLLWAKAAIAIEARPLFGYGYLAFWRGPNSPSAWLARVAGWDVPHAHNGFFDTALDLGLVGLAVFAVSWVWGLVQSLRCVRETRSELAIWPFLYITFLFGWNITESSLLRPNSIFWILYVAAVCTSYRILSASRGRGRVGAGGWPPDRDRLSRPAAAPVGDLHPGPGRGAPPL